MFPYGRPMAPPLSQSPSPQYVIYGVDTQIVQIHLKPGESCTASPGTYLYSSATMEMQARPRADTGLWLGRLLTTERVEVFTNRHLSALAYIAFSASQGGKLLPVDLRIRGAICCLPETFVSSVGDVSNQTKLLSIQAGLLSAEGLVFWRLSGNGTAFIHGGGIVIEKTLALNESLYVHASCLTALSDTCKIENAGNFRNVVFGSSKDATIKVSGPGFVYISSLPANRVVARIVNVAAAQGIRGGAELSASFPMIRCLRLASLLIIFFLSLAVLQALHLIALEDHDL